MAGVPLLNGFLSKEMFFAETVFISAHPVRRVRAAGRRHAGRALRGRLLAALLGRHLLRPAVGRPAARAARAGALDARADRAAGARVPRRRASRRRGRSGRSSTPPRGRWSAARCPTYSLAIWHGFNAPLAMSLVAMAGGIVGLPAAAAGSSTRARYDRIRRSSAPRRPARVRAHRSRSRRDLARAAASSSSARGGCSRSCAWLVVAALAAALAAASGTTSAGATGRASRRRPSSCCCGRSASRARWAPPRGRRSSTASRRSRCWRCAGLVTCLTFVWFSAPDLALTQLAVEVVTTVLFLLGLRWLPKRVAAGRSAHATCARACGASRDLVLAVAAGGGLAALSYAMLTRPAPQSISPFFLDRALPEGGGTNVVNVMLVDFRALRHAGRDHRAGRRGADRLRAAAPLPAAARERRAAAPAARDSPTTSPTDLVNPRTATDTARGLHDGARRCSCGCCCRSRESSRSHLFMRGHNEPGGGFVAGLVVAIALIAQYMVAGAQWVEARIESASGALDRASGLRRRGDRPGRARLGYPFLTTHTAHLAAAGGRRDPRAERDRSSMSACSRRWSARRC